MRRLLWAPFAVVLAACGGPPENGPDGGDGSFIVGPSGGEFERQGARIIVPANAVQAETEITVLVVDVGIPDVPNRKRISLGYKLGPQSVTLASPIEVELPYDEAMLPARGIDPSTYDMRRATGDDPYLQLGSPDTNVEQKTVRARTERLGLFWITSPLKPAVSEVTLSPREITLRVGETQQFTTEVTDPAGNPLPDVTVLYSVVPTRVAKVDETGLLEALAPGTATLTATAGDRAISAVIKVIGNTAGPLTFIHENPFPTGNDLLGGALAGAETFFVGKNGTILSRDAAGAFTRRFSYPTLDLRAAGGAAGGVAVAAGTSLQGGILVEVSGAQATLKVFPTVDPRSMWFDGTHGMAVGTGNDVLVRRNGQWTTEYSPSFETLLHVIGDGLGGFVTIGSLGSLYIFDPITQTWDDLYDLRLNVLLTAAVITDAAGSEAWAVGGNKLWHFQGGIWNAINLPATPVYSELTAVAVVDGRVVIGGRVGLSGELLIYSPGAGTFARLPMRGRQIPRGIFGSGTNAWAVGDFGAVWRYASGTFTEVSRGFYGDVADVFATPAMTVAVVNECTTTACNGKVYRRMGPGDWQLLGGQNAFLGIRLSSVVVKSATEVLVGGDNVIFRLDGTSWTPTSVSAAGQVLDMAVCGSEVWAVGGGGILMRGPTAPLQDVGLGLTSFDLTSVFCRDAGEIWVGGISLNPQVANILFAIRGSTAQAVNDPAVNHAAYLGVWSPGFNEVYAFGDARYGTYWNTKNLMVYLDPGGIVPDMVTGLWGSSVDNLYAVGTTVVPKRFGFALRFDGGDWRLVDAGTHRDLAAVHGSSATDIYLVSEGGGILRGVTAQ